MIGHKATLMPFLIDEVWHEVPGDWYVTDFDHITRTIDVTQYRWVDTPGLWTIPRTVLAQTTYTGVPLDWVTLDPNERNPYA